MIDDNGQHKKLNYDFHARREGAKKFKYGLVLAPLRLGEK
jgi:hypothetical protein